MHITRLLASFFVVVVLATSCAISDSGRATLEDSPAKQTRSNQLTRLQVSDIPVPPEMSLKKRGNRSFSFVGGGVRVANLVYRGPLTVDEVATFYEETMPLPAFGWSIDRIDRNEEETVLLFRKNDDNCEIKVLRDRGTTTAEVNLTGLK